MQTYKILPLAKSIVKLIPGATRLRRQCGTGGTNISRYCYTVWFTHFHFWSKYRPGIPETVAELGPGDSLGIGLAALLSGCSRLYTLDVHKYWNTERNLEIFDELVTMFRNKTEIPGKEEFPRINPQLGNRKFPTDRLTDNILTASLNETRVAEIRAEIENPENPKNRYIYCKIPWYASDIINEGSVDFIYSQAVLEHVEDLGNTYAAMYEWLKPHGIMSHTIDFSAHHLFRDLWNGHWTFSDYEWKIILGKSNFFLNRAPVSIQLDLHKNYRFQILEYIPKTVENGLKRSELAKRFRNFGEEDLTTRGAYILSEKE